MERQRQANGAQQRFVQILALVGAVPKPIFGEIITDQNRYAVSYEDSARKIPEWGRLRLSPHISNDMHGNPRNSYMVAEEKNENTAQMELGELARKHESDRLTVAAVHDVHHISEQSSSNGKGRILRTIKHEQVIYYSSTETPAISFQENISSFRQKIMAQLTKSGSHESLQDFKHIVQVVRKRNKPEYQYSLPADLPPEFLERIKTVELDVQYGKFSKQVNFIISKHEPLVLPFRPRSVNDPKETGIISAHKPFELHYEQSYLKTSIRDENAKLVHLESPSTTCAEKLNLLKSNGEWTIDNVIAAHFYNCPTGYVVLIGPRMNDVIQPVQLLERATGIGGISKCDILPAEMEHGTCTPFVYSMTGKNIIEKVVLLDLPERIMAKPADYSIGGHGPSAHRASIHATPLIAKQILRKELCDKVISLPHPYQSYW